MTEQRKGTTLLAKGYKFSELLAPGSPVYFKKDASMSQTDSDFAEHVTASMTTCRFFEVFQSPFSR